MKKYIYIVSAMILAASLSSCKKGFLEEAPVLSQSDVLTLSDFDGLNKATAGCYAPLASTDWYGEEFILINELKTMNGKKLIGTDYDSGRCKDHYNVNWTSDNTSGLWGDAYYTIVAASEVIDNLSNANGEVGIDEQDLKNLKAECLFIRALAHFDLVRMYAQPYCFTADASHLGVPVVLHKDPSGKPARAKVSEVYTAIVNDLTEAESIIGSEYRRAGNDPTAVVSLDAIRALLARVYLYSEQWQKAADYATKVIDSKHYDLWTAKDFADPTKSPYVADVQKVDGKGEVIFEVYGKITNTYDGYWDGLAVLAAPASYGDAGASNQLASLYEEGDARLNLLVDDSYGDGTKKAPNCLWTAKYLGKGLGNPDVTNVIVLRLSEMYLIRAEAVALHGATSTATPVADLTAIASRVGASTSPATSAGIAAERAKEFAWEGHLWFDLGRTKSDMTRVDESGTGVISEIKWGSKFFAMPIPNSQIKVGNLVQNDGYGK